ncbi:LuxR C-terminal-related transcriptional regulator, partial [Streptomyces katrae]|uniref:LuxR C-terminal-related transcriptional regulator n=1 Tax=Streptomyces katrae TaxID=68223 RepID=UPI00146FFA13
MTTRGGRICGPHRCTPTPTPQHTTAREGHQTVPTPGALDRCTCAAPSPTQNPRDLSTLTDREGTVLLLVATGLGNTPIARRLGIT